MLELDAIASQVEITALSIQERIARIHDALHSLHDLTIALYEATPRDESVIESWLKTNGFGIDSWGYFERLALLERARAGEVDPGEQIYYANQAISRDPEARFRMYALRLLPQGLETIMERLPGFAWCYYQDVTRLVIVYPMHDPCTVVPPDFDWHAYHTYQLVCPENNPERSIRWTPPNIDYGGKGLMVAPSIPLYRDGEFFGVWSFDVPVSSLIHDSLMGSFINEQQSFIVDREGVLIAHDTLDTLVAPRAGDVYRMPISDLGGGFGELDLDSLWNTGLGRLTDDKGVLCYAIARPIPALDWLLVATIPAQGVLQRMERSFLQAFDFARAGDLEYRVDNPGGEDIQHLVDSYNEMVEAVQSTLQVKEQTLRDLEISRDRARTIFEASPIGLGAVRADGSMTDLNEDLARILGLASQEGNDPDLMALVPQALKHEVQQLFDMALTKGRAGPIESELLHGEGNHIPVRLLARRLAQRDEMLVLLGVEDISETRQLQSRLLQTQKMQAIGQLAGGVAHDFNNLLCVIMANAAVLRHRLEEDATAKSPIDHIEQASERAAALTTQLLTFSRQEMIQMQRLDLAAIIRESEMLLHRLLDDNIRLEVIVDDDIPAVRADAGQIQQVVMNLVINAREALHGSGGRIEVHLSSIRDATDSPAARINVSDNGPGIDDDARPQIFKPFFTTKAHGTGLGLATVHEIVTALGGTVDVESVPGHGANFTVTIPAAQETGQPPRESSAFMDMPVEGCVVVVDDEPLVREAAARALEYTGIEFRMAADARQALAALEEIGDRAAILVTDVVMPEIGGRELAARARDLRPALPVLYMTGYTDDTILRHGVETAEVELLRKPFSPRLFVYAIKKTIARAARSRNG